MATLRKRLGELLLSHRLITQEQLDQALELQRKHFQPLGQILTQQNFVTEERILQACAMQKGVSAWHLQHDKPDPDALRLIPGNLCRSYQMIPVKVRGDRLVLAMRDSDDVDAIDMVRNISKMRVEPVLASEERLAQTIEAAYDTASESSASLDRLVSEAMSEFRTDAGDAGKPGVVTEAEMRPVVGLINQMLVEAVRMRASDIHIEPRRDRVEVRYRVDGHLQRVHELPSKLQAALTARVKIMAQIDIVEYRLPQDGRISMDVDGRIVDMRLSVLPTYYGQRIVLRILDKSIALRKLDELGFEANNLTLFRDMIHKPYGLVLVTGPTGSGKTTTLYAALNSLKEVANNIMTCEDPVEYDIDGINQSHVNEKVGLTFASQLRAILRQDPDIVLVGEIRDRETAETAIRAALTGHLVLSTLHCNDAPSAIPRLADMGVEPYLLSTALVGVVAQRLVRCLCPRCKTSAAPTPEEQALITSRFVGQELPQLWRPTGCAECNNAGYRGRMAIHEVFPTPMEVQRSIAAQDSMEDLHKIGIQYGYRPMQEDALDRMLKGTTTYSEARRLVFFESATPVTAAPVPQLQAA